MGKGGINKKTEVAANEARKEQRENGVLDAKGRTYLMKQTLSVGLLSKMEKMGV